MRDSQIEIKHQQAAIEPFWTKLPFLFAFPFRPGPLIFLGIIVVAGALAGFVLGPFGLIFRGILIYLGLRYAFNVLDLFAKGRFEGESVDHPLWGSGETRPAKLGLFIALFVALAVTLASFAVGSRVGGDKRAQDIVVADYQRVHAKELERAKRERDEWEAQRAEWKRERAAAIVAAKQQAREAGEPDPVFEAEPEEEAALPDPTPSREEMLRSHAPEVFSALWWKLLPLWFWVVVGIASLWLPSAALVIALDDSFFKALNPLFIGHFVRTMGVAFFVLWGFVLAIVGARQMVYTLGAGWPTFVRLPIELGLGTYLGIVLCALMGYVVYQFHQELHMDVEVDFDTHRRAGGAEAIAGAGSARAAVNSKLPDDPVARRAHQLAHEGKLEDAIAEVKDAMRYDRLDPVLNTQLHALYLRAGDKTVTLAHGQQWLAALARAGQGKQALGALHKLQSIDAAFAVQDGSAVVLLAEAALAAGEAALAGKLIDGFDKRFAEHKDLPLAYFVGARLLAEQPAQRERAAQMLRGVLAKWPQHARVGEMREALARIEAG